MYGRPRSDSGFIENVQDEYPRDTQIGAYSEPPLQRTDSRRYVSGGPSSGWQQEIPTLQNKGLEFVGKIGSGTFAEVWEVKLTGHKLACKVMEAKRENLKTAVDQMINEINVLRQLRHSHIISIDAALYIPDKQTDFPFLFVFIMMDLMEGSLMGLIDSWKRLNEEIARDWFRQITGGLYYLHEQNVSHLDIKAENILYRSNQNQFIFKLADFGIAKAFGPDNPSIKKDKWGTALFKAPELCVRRVSFIGDDYIWPEEYDTKACDIYSLGVTLGLSLIGSLMRPKTSAHKWITQSLVSTKQFDSRDSVIDLLFQMTQPQPIRRYRIRNVIDHHWLQNQSDL